MVLPKTKTSLRRIHTACWLLMVSGCRPRPTSLHVPSLFTAGQADWSLHQPISRLHPTPVIRQCWRRDRLVWSVLGRRWNARSALPLGTTRLPYNGNRHSLGKGTVTRSSASGKQRTCLCVCCSVGVLLLCGLPSCGDCSWALSLPCPHHPFSVEQVDLFLLFFVYFALKSCFLEFHSSMYDNLYLHGFEDSEAVSGGLSDTCKPCLSVVSKLADPYINAHIMHWDLSELKPCAPLGGGVGGRVCTTCARTCVYLRECLPKCTLLWDMRVCRCSGNSVSSPYLQISVRVVEHVWDSHQHLRTGFPFLTSFVFFPLACVSALHWGSLRRPTAVVTALTHCDHPHEAVAHNCNMVHECKFSAFSPSRRHRDRGQQCNDGLVSSWVGIMG